MMKPKSREMKTAGPLTAGKDGREPMKTIDERVKALIPEIRELSHEIHAHPEPGHGEYHAVRLLTGALERHGFAVERNVCGLETAFIASYRGEKPGRTVGFLAEYDALPGLGHACGHNLIGALAVACAVALKEAVDTYGGEARVIGAPAEETTGGKVTLAAAGRYDDLDAALLAHPAGRHAASGTMNAMDSRRFEFFGKSAHAAVAPVNAVNALEAVIETFNAVKALRRRLPPAAKVNGVILDGGRTANVIPEYAMAEFDIRARDSASLRELSERVQDCARAAARATGCRLEITNFEGTYDDLRTNRALSERAVLHTREFGVFQEMPPLSSAASSDIGNVSYRCPTIHQWFDVTGDPAVEIHTPELRACADADYGYEQMFLVARAFVATAEDVLSDDAFAAAVRAEFENAAGKD